MFLGECKFFQKIVFFSFFRLSTEPNDDISYAFRRYLVLFCNQFSNGCFCGIFKGMSTVVTNIRIDKELKAQATELFNDLGLTLSQAFTVFLKQAILHHGLPFAVTRPPSKELLEAIKEGEELAHDPNAKTYATPQELWDELGI